ncbi:uncharacterized protein LOC127508489 isoform X12 [Ctenopharyngodon idella]|uniref:uncharacterized protein LOC127508489 isoform X12 n=1 Tax=Ctenopharyngodon idella TaxID=7959 RepID=UPI00222E0F47|nr:uncharacterized protein LOC127508489 isoform X12 [Ctenopharyngodon idella]
MASAQHSATEHLKKNRAKLVTDMRNHKLIIENLYQKEVFNDHEVDALKAERTEFDKARSILDWVINKGEEASYKLLRILDDTRKKTLDSGSHSWIISFKFREDEEVSSLLGTTPCQNYQTLLKKKAKQILKNQRVNKYVCKDLDDFHFTPLVLETDSEGKTQCKIKLKNKKCKKLRPKKLRAYIPNNKQPVSPVGLWTWKDKNILLIGKPGIGKTTVVQEMMRLWAEKDDREFYYMFYFDDSVLAHSSRVANLESFLFDVYLKPTDKDRKEVFQDIEEKSENVVIVFDGISCVQEHSVLKKIMDHELLPEAKIIITCRSEVEDEPLFSSWPTRKVYVEGFSEESIQTYYQKKLGPNSDLLDVVLKNQELFSLSHVPMYAFMVVDFLPFKNGKDFNHPHTVTEMYIHIFRLAVKKHGKKQIKQIDKYLREIKDQIHPLMENAFSATMQKTLNLPDIGSDETDICHAFLKMITTTNSLSSAKTYCAFLHNTMQEFFSALWLLGHPDEIEKVLQLCQTEENQHMRHVLPFLCGVLGEHNINLIKCLFPEDQIKKTSDWFIEKFLDTFLQLQSESEVADLLYVCQCLYELQSPKACLMFLEKMDHQLEPEGDLDPHQCCALSYVIGQCGEKEVYLDLEDCNVTDTGMKLMLSCSPKIRLKIWKDPLKEIAFFLEFFHKVSQCSCSFFDVRPRNNTELCDFLLDLCSHVKNYETQTSRSFLSALQSVFQSPDVWIIDLSQRKTSILLEVLKLQTEKKPVELRGCSEEESDMMSFLQCLPYISQLRFSSLRKSVQMQFLLKLFIKAAETETQTGEQMMKLLTSVCTYRSFPYGETDGIKQRDFLLGLYSHVNNYKTQTGRSFLPALQSVFQSPDVWIIDLSQRKTSVLLEVLKLQTEKKPVDLRGCSEEESEIMSFLQCLPYISQLRFSSRSESVHMDFVLKLFIKAAETETQTGEQMLKLLTSVCTYSSFPYGWTDRIKQRDFLLDLCSHVKNYETQTGGSFLPALQSVFQSPDVWIIDLSQRKTSVLLEVLKLQTEKKPVELRGCSEEESEMMSFLQCLPYISQLRIHYKNRGQAEQFLLKLFNKAAETETQTGEQMLKLLTSVCTYSSFPYEKTDRNKQRDFLLDLCSHVKKYETQTALQSVFQSPDVWIIDLSKRKTSVLLKALKLQTVKKPVELRGCLEEEREMMSLLHCLPYISQLRFSISVQNRFILKVFIKAAAFEKQTGKQMLKLLASVCTYSSFPYERTYRIKQRDLLLDLYSHVKNYETQTGRSFLPALQSVFQLPDVWIIDLSQRKTSVLLEVLKLQTEKKPVKLRGCSEEESEMSFLQCLPYISQLRIDNRNIRLAEQFVLKLFIKAAETEIQTGEQMLKLLTSVCTYSSFPYERTYRIKQSDFLLDLYSHVKNYETQTGRSFLPALQSVFQLPDDWIIDLSQRKTSVLLEVLKLQTEKKPVELRGCSEEESEVRSFLQCLPYISQLRFTNVSESVQKRFHLKLLIKAAETETQTGEQMLKLLTSVCAYRSFPYQWTDRIKQRDFLLDLCSHVKNYETQTGGSFLPALQSVFQSPKVWIIDLSQRKTSVLLEVLKLQTEKKPVELRGCSEEESEMKSFLQCLPHISQLSCSERCLLTLVKVVQLRENPDLVTLLLEVLDFSFSLEGSLSSKICRSVGRVLRSSADRLNLTLKPEAISIRGTRLLFRHITHIHTLRLSGYMVVRIVQALRSMRVQTPVTVNELTLDPNDNQLSERKWSRVLSSLAILLRLWTVQCLNLTEYKMESVSLSVLLCHQGPLILRSSKESLQKLVECVCEAQEEELTQHFLQKVGGDLTSCSLSWEELHYFLQHKIQQITVDFRKSNIQCKIREILPFLNRIQFKRLSSSFMLSIMREIYESGSAGFVSSLLSSVKNYISLQSRELDSVHCAALRFTLQHCTAVSLNLLWTSIPEEELESIVPLFRHVSSLSVDRRLLLKMLHCCSVSDVQQEAAAVLLSVLQHKLDFCRSALDLTTNTDSEPLHLTTEDCRVMSTVIQRAHTHTQLIMQDCVINTAGMDQLFPVLRSVKLCCDKSLLLQFLAHVRPEEAVSLSRALGDEVDLSQTHLEPQVCRGLVLILEYSEGLTELDLSQCRLTDHSLDLLLPNLHKAQNIDFSGNSITDIGAQRIYSIVSDNSNIKTVRLFNNRIEFRQLFLTDPRFEIW